MINYDSQNAFRIEPGFSDTQTSVLHSFEAMIRTELVAKMFPDESCGTKDCDSQVGVRLTTARTTLIQSSFGNPRHKQIGLVVPRRSCGAIGRCKGPTRTGCDRSSLGETSGSGSSQHHDCVCSYSISDVIILESRWTSSTDDFGFGYQ